MAVLEDHASYLDWIRSTMDGAGELPGAAKTVGFWFEEAEPGRVVMAMDAGPEHDNPMGSLHGGILCDITDAAMGSAFATMLKEGETFTSLDHNIRFLRPFWTGRLTVEGVVVKHGRSTGMAEATVVDDQGRLIAKASSSCMVLRGDAAKGR